MAEISSLAQLKPRRAVRFVQRHADEREHFAPLDAMRIRALWLVDPGKPRDSGRPAAVQVYDLAGDECRLQVRATGEESADIVGPVTVTVTPADLVRPPNSCWLASSCSLRAHSRPIARTSPKSLATTCPIT